MVQKYDTNAKNGKNINTNTKFFTKLKTKWKKEIFEFCDITFEPIKIYTSSAPQNDCPNFSFVKVVGKKMDKKGRKTDIRTVSALLKWLKLVGLIFALSKMQRTLNFWKKGNKYAKDKD